MIIENIARLKECLLSSIDKVSSIGIVTHQDPDGDGFCSALALQEILYPRDVKIVLEEPAPQVYDYLDGRKRSIVYSDDLKYDLLIFLDCHELNRIGRCLPLVSKAKKIIIIDHHIPGKIIPEANTFIDSSKVCVGVIIFNMFKEKIRKLNQDSQKYIADAIYTTILNDTDNFLNKNTDWETYWICSELIKLGLVPGVTAEKFLMNKSPNELKFIGEVLSTIETYLDNKVLFMHSTTEMLEHNNLKNDATSKLTRWVKGTKGIEVITYFQQIEEEKYRLNLRSNLVNVNKIAVKFGGGGHKRAAGCKIKGSLNEVKNLVLRNIREQL